jgi:hypothetical protein
MQAPQSSPSPHGLPRNSTLRRDRFSFVKCDASAARIISEIVSAANRQQGLDGDARFLHRVLKAHSNPATACSAHSIVNSGCGLGLEAGGIYSRARSGLAHPLPLSLGKFKHEKVSSLKQHRTSKNRHRLVKAPRLQHSGKTVYSRYD